MYPYSFASLRDGTATLITAWNSPRTFTAWNRPHGMVPPLVRRTHIQWFPTESNRPMSLHSIRLFASGIHRWLPHIWAICHPSSKCYHLLTMHVFLKDEGEVKDFLGIHVSSNPEQGTITLTQPGLVDSVLQDLGQWFYTHQIQIHTSIIYLTSRKLALSFYYW